MEEPPPPPPTPVRFDDGALALMSLALPLVAPLCAAAADFPEPRPALLQRDRRGRLPSADAGRSTQCSSRHHLGGHDEFRDVREDEEDDGGVVEGFPVGSCSSTPPGGQAGTVLSLCDRHSESTAPASTMET